MTEEIINSDGSRNWQANILLDNIKRLEQDSKQLTQWLDEARRNADFWCDKCTSLEQENKELKEKIEAFKTMATVPTRMYNECERERCKYGRALEEILESAKFAQCLPYGSGNLEDCLNCDDDTTNNGQFCMEKRIHEIKTKCVEVLLSKNNF